MGEGSPGGRPGQNRSPSLPPRCESHWPASLLDAHGPERVSVAAVRESGPEGARWEGRRGPAVLRTGKPTPTMGCGGP